MKIAALDLGTNSFLCLIAEVSKSREFRVLHDESVIVRLGQELQKTGRLHPDALKRARECLTQFQKTLQEFQVDRVQAVATAAAREAENAEDFLQICHELKIPLTTLSGEQEAQMSFRGALDAREKKKALLIDIGGGSTEYIVGTPERLEMSLSLPYGAVKLTERFVSQQPVRAEDESKLRQFIKAETETVWTHIQNLKPEKILAVAGTPTALVAAILGEFDAEKIENYYLPEPTLKNWIQNFRQTSVEEKRNRYNLGARADIIFAGTLILEELLGRLKAGGFHVSTKGIRYGLAYQMLDDWISGPESSRPGQ
ncbi:MAG: Ppx/GppA family phosphatase [Bdellovibrionales bacterium]